MREILADKDEKLRMRAISALVTAGNDAAPFLGDVLMSSKIVEIRREASVAIVALNLKEESILPGLTHAVRDPDRDVRKHAMQALYRVAFAAKGAIPNLLENLKDKDVEMRTLTLTVIREIPVESEAIVKAVTPLLKDDDENVRKLAKEVLAFQGK
jgi:HEAT repeat protein